MNYDYSSMNKMRINIRTKLIFIFFITSIIPFLVATVLILVRINSNLLDNSRKYYSTLMETVSRDIDFIIESHVKTVENMLNLSHFQSNLVSAPYRSLEEEIEVSNRILGISKIVSGEVSAATIGLRQIADENISGSCAIFQLEKKSILDQLPYKFYKPSPYAVIPELGKLSAEPMFRDLETESENAFVFGSTRLSAGNQAAGRPTLLYKKKSPDYQGNNSFDILVYIGLHDDTLEKIYSEISDLRSGTLLILDKKNRILSISHPGSGDYFEFNEEKGQYLSEDPNEIDTETGMNLADYNLLLKDRSILRTPEILGLIQENNGKTTRRFIQMKFRNINYLVNYHESRFSGTRLIFIKPLDFIRKPINNFILFGIILTFLLSGIVTVLGLIFSRSFSQPLKELAKEAELISSGNYNVTLNVRSKDELAELASSFNKMLRDMKAYQDRLLTSEKEKLEIELAQRIQTSLLPKELASDYYDISAMMDPAEKIGGDYYDFIKDPQTGRIWLAIGDVSGHGLISGLISMMAQTCFNTIILQNPNITPQKLIESVNRVLFQNIKNRLLEDDFMTGIFLLIEPNGKVLYVGGHLDILIYRAKTGEVERIDTYGMWLGILNQVNDKEFEKHFNVDKDDVIFLFTDGLIEAMNNNTEQYDIHRLVSKFKEVGTRPAAEIRDAIYQDVKNFMDSKKDDISILVIRKK